MLLPQRFWDKIDPSGDCWEWTASRNGFGYGHWTGTKRWRQRYPKATIMAHRLVWMSLVGPIPEELTIDHLCRNPPCVNPDHLEPVPHQENVQRGKGGLPPRTHCRNNHPLEDDNLYVTSRGERRCRECQRKLARESARRRRAGVTKPRRPLLTECKRGHPYDDANTYVDPRGQRNCRACRVLALRRLYRRRKIAAAR